ncbi:cytoplasmic protein [Stereum hirsutum FP-91666 SS1]|uniref:Cytoplasmic protein n=1 Tax=Stereum hirsutum (strain FP-91666) TaxID=721885 RepID=R7RVG4_STEHR|nr:cytoplasmic protein [Stereum hirsutum FP-91666 SS1]EIM78979.1 cytoplasmic protein [Stereum hirsutum FP-91666 SS1]
MVLFFTSTAYDPPVTIYMGKDKVENEDLIKYAWPQDVWFHVDKLSSAHVYVRLPESIPSWEAIPEPLLNECAQLVKANSIEGNKKDNLTIIYTPGSNLKKTGDMAVGQVSFHNDKKVKRVHVPKRENPIINRLNKTKVERQVDHEQERQDRIRRENAAKRAAAAAKKKADADLAEQRKAEKAARSYDTLFSNDDGDGDDAEDDDFEYGGGGAGGKEKSKYANVREMEEDFM